MEKIAHPQGSFPAYQCGSCHDEMEDPEQHVFGPVVDVPHYDGVDAELLKLLSQDALSRVAHLFTNILRAGKLPARWKTAVVTALLKPDKDPSQAKSYRPVAITSLLCRTLERVTLARMLDSVQIPPEQFGFRKQSGTSEPLMLLSTCISDGFAYANQFPDMDKPRTEQTVYDRGVDGRVKFSWQNTTNQFRTLVASIDLTDAFPRVTREEVMIQYKKRGGSRLYESFLYDFLSDRSQRVRFGNAISASLPTDLGVPQGSCLGPYCFSLVSAGLIDEIRTVLRRENKNLGFLPRLAKHQGRLKDFSRLPPFDIGWYADDSFIAISGPRADKLVEVMSRIMDKFNEWAARNGLEISPKSTLQLFMNRQTDATKLDDDDVDIPELRKFKDLVQNLRCGNVPLRPAADETIFTPRRTLGVVFDSRLSMYDHVSNQIKQARKRLNALLTFRDALSPRTLRMLYLSHVFSKIMFASESWYHHADDSARRLIDIFHRSAARSLANLHSNTESTIGLALLDLPTAVEVACTRRNIAVARVMARHDSCPLRRRLVKDHDKTCVGAPKVSNTLYDRSLRPITRDVIHSRFPAVKIFPPRASPSKLVSARRITFDFAMADGINADSTPEVKLLHNNDRLSRLPSTSCHITFTDGSIRRGECGWAAVIQIKDALGATVHQRILYGRGTNAHSICTLEGLAILAALRFLARNPRLLIGPVVFVSDSLSMLQTLAKGPLRQTHALGSPAWEAILEIAQYQPIFFAHVFSHAGTEGNELADESADEACSNANLPVDPATPFDIARVARQTEIMRLKLAGTIPLVQAHAVLLNPWAPRLNNALRTLAPWSPSYRTMATQVIIHHLLAGIDFWIGGWRIGVQDRCPACKMHVSRSATNASDHPTVHFFMLCNDVQVARLRRDKLGDAPTPALLWSDPSKVIDYYIARKRLLKERNPDMADAIRRG
jgi:ribonuclease HI